MTTESTQDLLAWLTRYATELDNATPAPLRRIRVTTGEQTVEVEWSSARPPRDGPRPSGGPRSAQAGRHSGEASLGPPMDQSERADGLNVSAPMVGTFYRAPEPGAPPFVEVGDMVEAGQQVGIVEAMKLMNAIQTEHGGRVSEILVPDGAPVEYGEPLIALAPHDGD